jgi:HAD superfamily hydrolase (TIGR01549 family)
MKLKAVFFDLDGTLLDLDFNSFLPLYFQALSTNFSSLFPSSFLIPAIMKATEKMMFNGNPKLTNREVFWEEFEKLTGGKEEELEPLFKKFYREVFPSLRGSVKPRRGAKEAVRKAKEKGFKLALATNAVFPQIAVEERLSWAHISPQEFDFISSYEKMHFCKPNPDFFREIARALEVEEEDCLMVGDDLELDIFPAREAGLKTFFLGSHGNSDYSGDMRDLGMLLEEFDAS